MRKISLTTAELKPAANASKFKVPVERDSTTKRASENDGAVGTDTARAPVEQRSEFRPTAAGLGLLFVSTAKVAYPLSEPV